MLIEMTIAISLSILAAINLCQLYLVARNTYKIQSQALYIKSDLQLAMELINHRIRMAGYQGCVNQKDPVNFEKSIAIINNTTLKNKFQVKEKSNNDALVISECQDYQDKMQFVSQVFYIGDTGRKDEKNKNIYALYSKILNSRAQEISPEIHELKIAWSSKKLITYRLNNQYEIQVSPRELL